VYFFCGVRYAERIIVSLYSLRQHWHGAVTVIVTDDDCQRVIEEAAEDLELECKRVKFTKAKRHSAYLNKTQIPTWTPYDDTVFIDGDTIVAGTFDELFGQPLTITSFSDWHSQGRRMSGRISGWKGKSKAIDVLVAQQLGQSWPAINTGVFAFQRNARGLAQWNAICKAGAGLHMTDELAMQLLFPELGDDCRVLDDRYNCSPIYGVHKDDVRIWHCHGKKHLRRDAGREVWMPAFEAAREANAGGLADWAGKYDRGVRNVLAAA